MRQYRRLRRHLPHHKGEVKGRLLDEAQVSSVTGLLWRSDALVFASMTELGLHSNVDLERHRAGTAAGITANLTEDHHPNIHRVARDLADAVGQLPLQLYTQGTVLTQLLARVLDEATLYWVQRRPAELGQFEWMIDAKGDAARLTAWERWYTRVYLAHLQSRSLRQPLAMLEGADYSHFAKFEQDTPDFLLKVMNGSGDDKRSLNLRAIFEEGLNFSSAAAHELELADIVANALRRAFKGNLQVSGWRNLRALMVHRDGEYIDVPALNTTIAAAHLPLHYKRVLEVFRHGGRQMLV